MQFVLSGIYLDRLKVHLEPQGSLVFFFLFFLFLNLILMHHCGSNCYIVLGVCAINHQTIAYTMLYLTLYVDS